ncbi:hypothetical protein PHYBOEH_002841 [Phytophthora boehmeriae]|uniref:Uncharacterized protein n=1 Tax=Phytophthora boehmeriae TaxID=109152 RepID=A0A8T1WWV4_9STRA|nr:hypothetical protein PHYBOEH_002841 [Phytophthora boehmeriae]
MVYSHGMCSLVKTAMLCALSLSVLQSARAERFLNSESTSSSADTDECGISDGDKSVGIRVIDDKACASGGLGCYNDHCRFCRILDTAQSSGFEKCSTFGVEFPTMAPLITSTGACTVSSGDAAVGISAMTDPNCLYGGLGCFNDHCRFCKVRTTTQSEAFVDCSGSSNGSDSASTSAPPAGTFSPPSTSSTASSAAAASTACTLTPPDGDVEVGISIGTDPTCSAGGLGCINDVCRFCRIRTTTKSAIYTDCSFLGTTSDAPTVTPAATTETPTVTTAAPSADTSAPGATTEAPASTDAPAATTAAPTATTCSVLPSVGDAAVGINIVTDATCNEGGIGCIDNICRFCKVTTSTQSASFLDCATFGVGTSNSEVPTVTIDSDSASDDNDSASDDSDAGSDAADTPTLAPIPGATPPAADNTEAPPAASDADTPAPPTAVCTQTVSSGDAAVGIKIVTDATCSTGGTGCIDNVCRFCKVAETTQSSAFVDCNSITSSGSPADASAGSATTDAPTTAPDATTETPSEAPATTTETPTEAPDTTTPSAPTAACTQTVNSGDAAVGINIVTDPSCSSGGTGCIDNVCRFCKVAETTQSSAFVDCSSISTTADAATEAPTDAPTDAPDATTEAPADATTEPPADTPDATTEAPPTAACTQTVSSGDAAVGINIVTDASCSSGGTGCIDNVCRFCKVAETTQSSAFVDCSSISSTGSPTDVSTEAPTDATADAPTETPTEAPDATTEAPSDTPDATTEAPPTAACTQTVSSGDAAVGINIVTDASCSSGGAGCIDDVCRFCKVTETTQSAAFVDCSSIPGAVSNSEALTTDSSPLSNTKTTLAAADSEQSDNTFSILKKNPTEVIAGAAAAFGVVAAVVAIAIAAKRSHTREAIPAEPSLDDEEDAERGERASPPASENAPIIPTEA